MRIAVIHDWLYTYGGAERVLSSILRCVPGADLFTLFDILPRSDRERLGAGPSHTSFLQRMPGIARRHRLYLPLMPLAIEQFDLAGYDVVISSSYAVAKGVLTGPDQLHLSYVHSPMRYAWDLQHQYLRETRLTGGLKSALARLLLHRMRLWDVRTGPGVDAYIANSHFVGRRIRKVYGRDATIIHPPVAVPVSPPARRARGDVFLTASRLVPYKNVRTIIEAFNAMPDQKLIVAGDGPERERLAALANPNVTMLGFVSDAELRRLMGEARAFVFGAEEDFGIVPVEAQGEGTPVIALGRGGLTETIVTEGAEPTGVFFDEPNPEAIMRAVRSFLPRADQFSPLACHANALRFSEARFEQQFTNFLDRQIDLLHARLRLGHPAPNAYRADATADAA
jgi:glycosyltransferase involved in cell wall biosynthesis